MSTADTDSGTLISERVAGSILAVAALLHLAGRRNGSGAEPLPAGAGRHRAWGADG
jgi:hypothetical protein